MGWPIVAAIAGSTLLNYLGDRDKEKNLEDANDEALRLQNEQALEIHNAKQAQFMAQLQAQAANMEARNAALEQNIGARGAAFGMTQAAGNEENQALQDARKGFEKLSITQKKQALEKEKARRKGATQAAARGAKVAKIGKGKGRLSSAYRGALPGAMATGAARGAHRGGQMAALSAYAADQDRERQLMGDVSAYGRARGMNAQGYRQAAQAGERRASQDLGLMNQMAASELTSAMQQARLLGPEGLPYRPSQNITPQGSTIGDISDLAGTALSIYGALY